MSSNGKHKNGFDPDKTPPKGTRIKPVDILHQASDEVAVPPYQPPPRIVLPPGVELPRLEREDDSVTNIVIQPPINTDPPTKLKIAEVYKTTWVTCAALVAVVAAGAVSAAFGEPWPHEVTLGAIYIIAGVWTGVSALTALFKPMARK